MRDLLSKTWICLVITALLAVCAHFPAFDAEFVWDDAVVASVQAPYIQNLKDAVSPPQGLTAWSPQYFRPLVTASYLADNKLNDYLYGRAGLEPEKLLAKERARIPHGVTVLLHALASVLTALLAGKLLGGDKRHAAMLAAGAVFALHPANGEVVNLAVGRSDALAAVFSLAGVLALLWAWDRKKLLLALPLCFYFAALLSKETAIFMAVMLPLTASTLPRDKSKIAALLAGVAAVTLLYFTLRGVYLDPYSNQLRVALAQAPWQAVSAFGFYVRQILVPWPRAFMPLATPGFAPTLIFVSLALALCWFAYGALKRGQKTWALLLAWFMASLAPAFFVAIYATTPSPVAERYLYLPGVAFAVAAGLLVASCGERRLRPVVALFAGLMCLYGVSSWQTSALWSSELGFWTGLSTRTETSRSPLVWNNLGIAHLKADALDQAEQALNEALKVASADDAEARAIALNGLGGVWFKRGEKSFRNGKRADALADFVRAQEFYSQAVGKGIENWLFYYDLALSQNQAVYLKRMDGVTDRELVGKALMNLEQARRLNPGNPKVIGLYEALRRI